MNCPPAVIPRPPVWMKFVVENVGWAECAESKVPLPAGSAGSSACPASVVVTVPIAVDRARKNAGAVVGATEIPTMICLIASRDAVVVGRSWKYAWLAVFTPARLAPAAYHVMSGPVCGVDGV